MFYLFSDILMYAKPRLHLDAGAGYQCCCILPLQHCTVNKVLGQDGNGQAALFSVNIELVASHSKFNHECTFYYIYVVDAEAM